MERQMYGWTLVRQMNILMDRHPGKSQLVTPSKEREIIFIYTSAYTYAHTHAHTNTHVCSIPYLP